MLVDNLIEGAREIMAGVSANSPLVLLFLCGVMAVIGVSTLPPIKEVDAYGTKLGEVVVEE